MVKFYTIGEYSEEDYGIKDFNLKDFICKVYDRVDSYRDSRAKTPGFEISKQITLSDIFTNSRAGAISRLNLFLPKKDLVYEIIDFAGLTTIPEVKDKLSTYENVSVIDLDTIDYLLLFEKFGGLKKFIKRFDSSLNSSVHIITEFRHIGLFNKYKNLFVQCGYQVSGGMIAGMDLEQCKKDNYDIIKAECQIAVKSDIIFVPYLSSSTGKYGKFSEAIKRLVNVGKIVLFNDDFFEEENE